MSNPRTLGGPARTDAAHRAATAARLADRGVARCRAGHWKEGLVDLAHVFSRYRGHHLPSQVYSYLGFGLARHRRQIPKGIRLCRQAIRLEFYQPENYLNLARTCLLSERYRREAVAAVRDGLKIDPGHAELLALQARLGARRQPVLGFLSRRNLLNRLLGWLRHQLSGGSGSTSSEVSAEPIADDSATGLAIA
ncbi:MAG: hypothetical protein AAGN46_10740 [Acidobacteriota bacterium]